MSNELKSPNHYTWRTRECYEIQQDMTAGSFGWTAYAIANIIKYLYRYPMKGGVDDLRKAQRYLKLLIQNEYPMTMEEVNNADTGVEVPKLSEPTRDAGAWGADDVITAAAGMLLQNQRGSNGSDAQRVRDSIQRPGVDTQVSLPQESREYIEERVNEVDELQRKRR